MFLLLLTGIGLAAACGLNAYLPLLILALADIMSTQVDLVRPWDILSSTWGIVILLILLPLELIPDKIAKIDHISDLLHGAIRPAAAAIAMIAVMDQEPSFNLVGALIIGLVIGAAIHTIKAKARPAINVQGAGVLTPVVSLLEDAVSGLIAILAIALPLSVIVTVPLGLALLIRQYRSLAAGTSRLMAIVPGKSQPTQG